MTRLSEQNIHFFSQGTDTRLSDKAGGQLLGPGEGGHFALWAPSPKGLITAERRVKVPQ